MSTNQTLSIKEFLLKYAIIIFMVIFLVAVFHYLAYREYIKSIRVDENQKTLQYVANSVSRSLSFYQSIAEKIATQTTVVDLLQFGTKEETQRWANNMQKLVPESIGFTLFDNKGEMRGVETELRLSDRCMQDMERRFNNLPIAQPPVHSKIAALAHYDIVSPVKLDGENIGLVFVSFSLNTVQRLVAELVNENQYLRITSPAGVEIASAGHVPDDEGVSVFEQKIESSDWVIELKVINAESGLLVTSLLISNLVAFLLISITLYISMHRFFDIVVSDFEKLSWIMMSIKAGTYNADKAKNVSLKEAEHVARFIAHTAVELNEYQEKLKYFGTTDELTGLANRRVLNAEIDAYLKQEVWKQQKYLLILDLDYFKEINDTYGHDAGDFVLKLLAKTLLDNTKGEDLCTRSGGDEFILLMTDYSRQELTDWYLSICEDMNKSISRYNTENRINVKFGISAGATLIVEKDLKSPVLKRADEALYIVKGKGRGAIEFF